MYLELILHSIYTSRIREEDRELMIPNHSYQPSHLVLIGAGDNLQKKTEAMCDVG